MKATIDIPDELYRKVKAKSALEGRAVREVTIELYRRWVEGQTLPPKPEPTAYACLVRMSEQHDDHRICTLDSDFTVYRKHGRTPIPLIIPASAS